MKVSVSLICSAFILFWFASCQKERPAKGINRKAASNYHLVIATQDPATIEGLLDASWDGLQISEQQLQGGERDGHLAELIVNTKKDLVEVIKLLESVPGVRGVAQVQEHRHQLVVQFKQQISSDTASERLKSLNPLMVRTPGGRKKSPYFEVLIETDESLDAVVASAEKTEGVILAEPSSTYIIE